MIEIENMRSLRKLLIEKRIGEDKCARTIKSDLFDQITTNEPSDGQVQLSLKWSFCGIAANAPLATDSHLVAGVTRAWTMAYPNINKLTVLNAILGPCNTYITGAGEGIAIGLLEMVNEQIDDAFESRVLSSFGTGSIVSSMIHSTPTTAGSGRLTNAIHSLTMGSWVKGTTNSRLRRHEIIRLLIKLDGLLRATYELEPLGAEPSDYFWNFSKKDKQSFLEKFADELSKRFFANTPLSLRFHLCNLLEKNLPVELA